MRDKVFKVVQPLHFMTFKTPDFKLEYAKKFGIDWDYFNVHATGLAKEFDPDSWESVKTWHQWGIVVNYTNYQKRPEVLAASDSKKVEKMDRLATIITSALETDNFSKYQRALQLMIQISNYGLECQGILD